MRRSRTYACETLRLDRGEVGGEATVLLGQIIVQATFCGHFGKGSFPSGRGWRQRAWQVVSAATPEGGLDVVCEAGLVHRCWVKQEEHVHQIFHPGVGTACARERVSVQLFGKLFLARDGR